MRNTPRDLLLGALFLLPLLTLSPADAATEYVDADALEEGFTGVWMPEKQRDWDPFFRSSILQFGAYWNGLDSYGRNLDVKFMPASTSKIFTAGYALEAFGPDYRYETRLEYRCLGGGAGGCETVGGLTLVGSGDPTWGRSEFGESSTTRRLEKIAGALRARGVRNVKGGIRATSIDARLDGASLAQGWQNADYTAHFGSFARSFNVGINYAGMAVTGPKSAAWVNPLIPSAFDVDLKPGASTKLSSVSYRDLGNGTIVTVLRGTWGGKKAQWSLPVLNTAGWVRGVFGGALERSGIRVEQGSDDGRGAPAEPLRFYSEPLSEILVPFLKSSDNFLGDALWKTAAVRSGGSSANIYEAGKAGFAQHLAGVISRLVGDRVIGEGQIAAERVNVEDGSGLSRMSYVTPRTLAWYLDDFSRRAGFEALWKALPVAGRDGTLRNRMKGTSAAGITRAKTGTLFDVSNLSGLIPATNGRDYLPFVVLSKAKTRGNAAVSRGVQDKVVVELTRQYRGVR